MFYRSLSAVNHASARCDRCGSARLARVVSKVRVLRGAAEDSLGPAGDVDESLLNEMGGLDENDPRALGRFMRKMAGETGEDLGPEMNEVIGRLEKGENPDKIEQDMGDLFGGEGGMDDPMGDDMGALPEAAASAADKAEKTRDQARTAKRKTTSSPRRKKAKKGK